MKKIVSSVLLIIGLSIYATSATADEIYRIYCHKKTGECFSPIEATDTTLEYFGNRVIENYETVFLNIKPVINIISRIKEIDGMTEEEKDKVIPLAEATLPILIYKNKYKLFQQVEEYPKGSKKIQYTGYGINKNAIEYIHGQYILWYESGKKEMEANYKYGEVDGTVTAWYQNGIKQLESQYKYNKRYGLTKSYDSKGILKYKDTYKNDEKTNRKAYDREGKIKFDQDY